MWWSPWRSAAWRSTLCRGVGPAPQHPPLCRYTLHICVYLAWQSYLSCAWQFTHFISQEAAIWTSVAAREHRHANEDAELSIVLTDRCVLSAHVLLSLSNCCSLCCCRLRSLHQAALLEIPSSASALTGAVLSCALDTLTLPQGIQSSDIVQFLPALPSSGIGSKLLRRNGQVVPYSTAGLSSSAR